jgi:hypothetical protein
MSPNTGPKNQAGEIVVVGLTYQYIDQILLLAEGAFSIHAGGVVPKSCRLNFRFDYTQIGKIKWQISFLSYLSQNGPYKPIQMQNDQLPWFLL